MGHAITTQAAHLAIEVCLLAGLAACSARAPVYETERRASGRATGVAGAERCETAGDCCESNEYCINNFCTFVPLL